MKAQETKDVELFALSVYTLGVIEGMKAENIYREGCGHTIAYDEDAFIDVLGDLRNVLADRNKEAPTESTAEGKGGTDE